MFAVDFLQIDFGLRPADLHQLHLGRVALFKIVQLLLRLVERQLRFAADQLILLIGIPGQEVFADLPVELILFQLRFRLDHRIQQITALSFQICLRLLDIQLRLIQCPLSLRLRAQQRGIIELDNTFPFS